MKPIISIILIEDHPEYRDLLEAAIDEHPAMELNRKFGAAEMALRSLEGQSTRPPDLILLDLNLPGISGIKALPLIKKQLPEVKIIVLTQSNKESDVVTALATGANGYLLKSATLNQIRDCILSAMRGGTPIDDNATSYILKNMRIQPPVSASKPELSNRETEVLTLLSEGFSQKEISEQLGITSRTVSTHITHIYEKLNVPNAPAAINKAHNWGLFS